MGCTCTENNCAKCKCGGDNKFCTLECHQKKPWDQVSCLNHETGQKVKAMKIKDVRTAIIANSLSPIGDQGELRKRLSDFLLKNDASESSKNGGEKSSGGGGGGGSSAEITALFDAIVNNEGDNAFILSLSGKEVSKLSGKGDLRKAYLILSTRVHPDKNAGSTDAVQAFQIVLSAYENLVNPPQDEDEDGETPAAKRKKTERFTRSNGGCFKTNICCPQCKQVWGEAWLGLEESSYNFLMMGVKKYICGRCACLVGCMTAIHYCPHCKKTFDYDSDDYHRKIICGNEKCKKEFGFWMYKVSERREKEIRQEVKKEFEEERKKIAQKKRRAARAGKRIDKGDSSNEERLQMQLFVIGLRDACPRCGWELSKGEGPAEATQHIEDCNDKKAIEKHQKRVAKQKEEAERKKNQQEDQYEVMALKRWEMSGRQVGQLWMLSEYNITKQCELLKLSTEGAKHEMIARLCKHIRSKERLMITDGKTGLFGDVSYDTCTIGNAEEEDLPENIETMDREDLQDLCASYNIKFDPKKDAKVSLIKKFASSRAKGKEQLLICDKQESSSEEEDSDEEYQVTDVC